MPHADWLGKLSRLHVAEYLHTQLKKCQLCVPFSFCQHKCHDSISCDKYIRRLGIDIEHLASGSRSCQVRSNQPPQQYVQSIGKARQQNANTHGQTGSSSRKQGLSQKWGNTQEHLFPAMIYEAWPVGRSPSHSERMTKSMVRLRRITRREPVSSQHMPSLSCIPQKGGCFFDCTSTI